MNIYRIHPLLDNAPHSQHKSFTDRALSAGGT